MFTFNHALPEEAGVPSTAVLRILDRLAELGIEMHSLTVVRHDRILAQGFWKPYTERTNQLMYSATKSLTAVAIGFAVQEGFLRMDETLGEIFNTGEEIADSMKPVTIENLLTMSCGQETETNPYQSDWIHDFLLHEAVHKPGDYFFYNTTGVDALTAILRRRTGQNLLEFLRPRLFDPLGISRDILCGTLPDGTEIGGGGIFWKTEDYLRFTRFLLHHGEWEGRQLLSAEWMEQACTARIHAVNGRDYGYLIWVERGQNIYSSRGMLGQFGICVPDREMMVVVTAQAAGIPDAPNHEDAITDILQETLFPAVVDEVLPITPDTARLAERLNTLELPALVPGYSPMEKAVSGRTYLPVGEMNLGGLLEYFFGDGDHRFFENVHGMRFDFDRPSKNVASEQPETRLARMHSDRPVLYLVLTLDTCTLTIPIALDGQFHTEPVFGETIAACGRWRSYHVLELEIRLLERIMGSRYLFRFEEGTGKMRILEESLSISDWKHEENIENNWDMKLETAE